MIPDAIISCSFLLLGSGHCVYRLIKHSYESTITLPQFVIASVGVVAIGARSLHALFYNTFWRSYPIDPMEIAKELQETEDKKNYVDWTLSKIGIASLVYSFYHHYEFIKTGIVIFVTLVAIESLKFIEEISSSTSGNRRISEDENTRIMRVIQNILPFPASVLWIISTEMLGRAVGNPFFRIANFSYAMSEWAFPREGFYTGWWITHSSNDYTMLAYLIIITEGLCLSEINK